MDFETLSKLEGDIGQAQIDLVKLQAMLALLVDYLTKYNSNNIDQRLWITREYIFQAPYAETAEDLARQIEQSLAGAYQGFDILHKAYVANRKSVTPPYRHKIALMAA